MRSTAQDETLTLAAEAVRGFLAGQPLDDPWNLERFGCYVDLINRLLLASVVGVAEVRTLWDQERHAVPQLAAMIEGDEGDGPSWPVLDDAALYGLAGEIVQTIRPYTEADPVALLLNSLTAFGNIVGDRPHFQVEFTKHPLRLFVGLVGETAKARKGLSWSTPRHLYASVDEAWASECVTGGLSSGEGVIHAVRDGKGEDAGVSDKRLLLVEEELAQGLKVLAREGNILSAILRQAWDTGNLHPLTRNNPLRATGAHISIIGHITREELLRYLNDTEQANGFANRFLWACVRRSRPIPNPTGTPQHLLNPLITKLHTAVRGATAIGLMRRDNEAEQLWSHIYAALWDGKPGLLGTIIARAEAQVMRLACIYAAMDCLSVVTSAHLKAAVALWEYCEASAAYIFGESLGDSVADEILRALRRASGGMTRTGINHLFGRNKTAARLNRALSLLEKHGFVLREARETDGRTAEVWVAARTKQTNDTK